MSVSNFLLLTSYLSLLKKKNKGLTFSGFQKKSNFLESAIYINFFHSDITTKTLQHQGPMIPLVGFQLQAAEEGPPSLQGED